ncbi:hypothetical protein ACLK17_07890 [Escherichia coli]
MEKGVISRPRVCNGYSGQLVEEAGLGQEMGEPDRTCVPVLGSNPSAANPEFIGQMLLTMVDEDGAPFDVEPRTFLTACGSSYASANCSRL